jgi:choline dehydrogenase-like flavoprotein
MTWDAIVVGSGFGGAMAAHALVNAGLRVLMVERGGWVARGPENWGKHGAGLVTPSYTMESPYEVTTGRRRYRVGSWHCVGGQSVFYGGASYRFRESDFEADPEIVGNSGAEWPFRYDDIEPFYSWAEELLGVAGDTSGDGDRTAPHRGMPYPQHPASLSGPAQAIADAARRLGLAPSRIPLAIAYEASENRRSCMRCGSCDGYACAAEAKNDLATAILPQLMRRGMTLRTNVVCVRVVRVGSRVTAVECVDRVTGERTRFSARAIVLAAGALATPHLLLASNLAAANPASDVVGRYLTRHRNAVAFGVFGRRPNPERVFDKQVAIMDFYLGDPRAAGPPGRLGSIQQLTPPLGLVRAYLPRALRVPAAVLVSHSSGLLVIAEDQPRRENGVAIDWSVRDRFGMPTLRIRHAFSARDDAAAAVLIDHARRVLREAGARFTWVYPIGTFSHALGTVRMGPDAATAPLDADGRFRGLDNLYVTDGSALPRSAGVNPSLTIAANALRIGVRVAQSDPRARAPVWRASRKLPIAYNSPPVGAS